MLKHLFNICLYLAAIKGLGQDRGVILEKHFSAIGQELWNQINDVSVDGRWVDENYYGHKIKLTYKTPGKIRIEGKYKAKTFIEAYNGTYGWIVAPWKSKYELQRMTPEEELIIRNSFSIGSPLYAFREKLAFEGHKYMEGAVYNAFVYEDDQIKKTFYIDQDDHKLYYESIVSKADQNEVLKIYENYRTYSGLSIPEAVRFEGEDLERELVFDQVYIGLGARGSLFEPPGQ